VSKLCLFGSMARDEATAKSDLDLLVYFSKRKSLLTLVELEWQLRRIFKRKVDLLTEGSLSPYIRTQVLREAKVIYEA